MGEEVQNAPIEVARSMVASVFTDGALQFGILLVLLIYNLNIESVSSDQFPAMIDVLSIAVRHYL